MQKRLIPESVVALHYWIRDSFFTLAPSSPLTRKPLSEVVKKALVFSYRNRHRKALLKEAALAVGVKPGRLERRLKKETGIGFHTWHTGERVELAKERMNIYGDPPKVAMQATGFGKRAYAHFSRVFRSWFRACPHDFWRECRKRTPPEGWLKMQLVYEKLMEFQSLMCLVHEGKASWQKKAKAVYELKLMKRGFIVPPEYSTGEAWRPRERTKK